MALRSEGIKMTVGSELPHFIAMDNDILSAGVVIYHLQVCTVNKCVYVYVYVTSQMGNTTIGTTGSDIGM